MKTKRITDLKTGDVIRFWVDVDADQMNAYEAKTQQPYFLLIYTKEDPGAYDLLERFATVVSIEFLDDEERFTLKNVSHGGTSTYMRIKTDSGAKGVEHGIYRILTVEHVYQYVWGDTRIQVVT